MERQRGITIPETLLRLFLLHVARGYSLRETSVRANEAGLATISDVGLLKRRRRSEEWRHLLSTQVVLDNAVPVPQQHEERTVRLTHAPILNYTVHTASHSPRPHT